MSERGKITEVKTYWNVFYQTSDGLHIGLAEDDIRYALGAPRTIRRWSHFRALYYTGIIFTIDADSTIVTGIGVIPDMAYARTTRHGPVSSAATTTPPAPFAVVER